MGREEAPVAKVATLDKASLQSYHISAAHLTIVTSHLSPDLVNCGRVNHRFLNVLFGYSLNRGNREGLMGD